MNTSKINDRLDAVEDMMKHQYETDVLRSKLAKMPDLERLLAKLYTYSVKHKVKAIYFENVTLNKLKEFRTLMKHFKSIHDVTGSLKGKDFKSTRLHTLLTPDSEGGLYPQDICSVIAEFEGMIVWKKTQSGEEEIPEPQPGLDEEFD